MHEGALIMNRAMSIFWAILIAVSLASNTGAEPQAMEEGDMKALLKGKDAFSVTPPQKWHANIEDANARGMYAYFVMDGYTYADSPGIIYIRVMDKLGQSVAQHLQADIDGYRKNKKDLKVERFTVSGLDYTHAAKKYVYGKTSCDYVCFIDPGKGELSYLVFVLTAEYKQCDTYKSEFETMVKSFVWNGGR